MAAQHEFDAPRVEVLLEQRPEQDEQQGAMRRVARSHPASAGGYAFFCARVSTCLVVRCQVAK